MSADPSAQPARRAAVVFIFVTVMLDVLALGIVIPVLPKLVESFVGGDTAKAARIYGLFATVWALMQFVGAPIQGALSDRFGRRPVILFSTLGLGLDYVFMALAPSVGWLFVGRVISGFTAASFSAASAYIADITPPEKRAAAFGLIGAAFGLGFVLGPALGGIVGEADPRLPFWIAAGLTLVNAAYGFFVLPESLPKELRRPFSWRRANPLGSLKLVRSREGLPGLATLGFLYQLSHYVFPSVFVLFAGYRFGWSERDVGLTLAATGVCSVIVQGGLVRRTVAKFGERRTLFIGIAGGVVGLVMYGLAPTGVLFLAAVPVFALVGFFNPAVQGLMTRRVEPTEQGQLQGVNSSLMGIAGLVGPVVFSNVFASFVGPGAVMDLPGAPFLLAALILLVALGIAWRTARLPATARDASVS